MGGVFQFVTSETSIEDLAERCEGVKIKGSAGWRSTHQSSQVRALGKSERTLPKEAFDKTRSFPPPCPVSCQELSTQDN